MKRMGFSTLLSGLGVLLLLATSCGPAPAAAPTKPAAAPAAPAQGAAAAPPAQSQPASSALQQLIEGAKSEPVLKAQWSSSSFGGGPGLNEIVADMNKKYGLNVQAQFTPGRDMQALMELLAQENAAGQPASTDVYLGNAPAMVDALRTGVLRTIDWKAILDRPIPADPAFDPYAPDGTAVAFGTTLVGIAYNTNLVRGDDVPRRMEDPLAPKWKGKIASTPYAAGMREFAMPDMLGRDYILDYTKRLSQQVGGLIRCGENERLTSGEFAMLVFACGGNDVAELKGRGAPIDYAIVQEATVLHMRYGAVPKNSSAPNAATLLVAYLLSPEGQELLWKLDGMDLPLFPESHLRDQVDQVKNAGGKVAYNSPQWLLSSPGFTEQQQELEKILRENAR
ncbi:MAG TPA: extracellular solute-binding protein [Chloroflexota bacterium]|nr:extracellular solute-binding protein [Chloroflexota bacterium]